MECSLSFKNGSQCVLRKKANSRIVIHSDTAIHSKKKFDKILRIEHLLWINFSFYECYQLLLQNNSFWQKNCQSWQRYLQPKVPCFCNLFLCLGGHLLCSCKNQTVKKVIWALFILQLYLRSNFWSEDNDFLGAFVAKMELFSGDKIHMGWVHLNERGIHGGICKLKETHGG